MNHEPRPANRRRWPAEWRVVAAALLVAAFLPAVFMREKSVTSDEVAHLPAGYSYLATGRIVLNPMHPPLLKELAALPLLALGARIPAGAPDLREPLPVTAQWEFGEKFLLSQDADRLLFWGRMPIVLLSVALAVVVARWSADLWGPAGGLLALALYVFDPTITAHAELVTTDVGMAFFATWFFDLLRRWRRAPCFGRLVGAGIVLGCALGSKFSAVIVVPMAAALLLVVGVDRGRRNPLSLAVALAAMVALAALVLWAIYLFPLDPFFYVHGLAWVNGDHNPRALHMLLGELKPGGWPHYLSVAWLLKTPIPELLLLAGAIALFARGGRTDWREEAFVIVPALGFFAANSLLADPIGVRYLIPCLPFFFIFTARLAAAVRGASRPAVAALVLLVVWDGAEYAAIAPDHLSYFNELAGGPSGGLRWLDDSNVDWGQGLIQLRRWLDRHPLPRYRLCYFGSFEPRYYGIEGAEIPMDALASPPPGETLILSANCVARVRAWLARDHDDGPENWLAHATPQAVVGHAYYVYRAPGAPR